MIEELKNICDFPMKMKQKPLEANILPDEICLDMDKEIYIGIPAAG